MRASAPALFGATSALARRRQYEPPPNIISRKFTLVTPCRHHRPSRFGAEQSLSLVRKLAEKNWSLYCCVEPKPGVGTKPTSGAAPYIEYVNPGSWEPAAGAFDEKISLDSCFGLCPTGVPCRSIRGP